MPLSLSRRGFVLYSAITAASAGGYGIARLVLKAREAARLTSDL